ncbi:glycosyltransferase family 4 protein [Hazenella coriacea]|uniref:Glycosyl transferase family 1 n=1 Tax=Hazenella coriacea TaxID=1179467 RepID=A0A4V2UUY5_9BACL|nr:glycosyltransferase family 4 protein [Hazenella coriacea]TCS93637.1 glycosyl transferase family 1 [Hazenella coriacea]
MSFIRSAIWKDQLKHLSQKRKKMVILSTYPVFHKAHGGMLRVYHLYKNLENKFDITIISFNYPHHRYQLQVGNLTEIAIPPSEQHLLVQEKIQTELSIDISDIMMERFSSLTPEYQHTVDEYLEQAEIIVAAQPYLFHLIEKCPRLDQKLIIYDSQNVEYELKKSMLPNNEIAQLLLSQLFQLEQRACQQSDLILTCTLNDSQQMQRLYEMNSDKFVLVPNGVDHTDQPFINYQQRQENKRKQGLSTETNIIFIGSGHPPNVDAVTEILKISPLMPEFNFIIMGGLQTAFAQYPLPNNVLFTGRVDEYTKKQIYSIADIAINPMLQGSGSNLKLAEFMAHGIPVVSTAIGARGYKIVEGEHLIISDLSEFPKQLRQLKDDPVLQQRLSSNARLYIEKNYSWSSISKHLLSALQKLL